MIRLLVNLWWSEKVKEDLALRALRPTFLPLSSDSGELVPAEGSRQSDSLQLSALNYLVNLVIALSLSSLCLPRSNLSTTSAPG